MPAVEKRFGIVLVERKRRKAGKGREDRRSPLPSVTHQLRRSGGAGPASVIVRIHRNRFPAAEIQIRASPFMRTGRSAIDLRGAVKLGLGGQRGPPPFCVSRGF